METLRRKQKKKIFLPSLSLSFSFFKRFPKQSVRHPIQFIQSIEEVEVGTVTKIFPASCSLEVKAVTQSLLAWDLHRN